MTGWRYVLQAECETPPCPTCGSRLSVVALPFDHWCCTDCWPRRAWLAERVAEAPAPVAIAERRGKDLAG